MSNKKLVLSIILIVLVGFIAVVSAQDTSEKDSNSFFSKIIEWFKNLTKKDVSYLNKVIAQKFAETNSFSYEFTEIDYQIEDKIKYASKFKRPDMIKTESEGRINICNKNSYYTLYRDISYEKELELVSKMSEKSKELGVIEAKEWFTKELNKIPEEEFIDEIKYINLPSGMESYCSESIDNSFRKFLIPSDLSDTSKYKASAVTGKINSIKVVIIKIEILDDTSEETKEKYKKAGIVYREKEPSIYKIYVDAKDYSIIREEGYKEGELIIERDYHYFEFNPKINENEFEVDGSKITSKRLFDFSKEDED